VYSSAQRSVTGVTSVPPMPQTKFVNIPARTSASAKTCDASTIPSPPRPTMSISCTRLLRFLGRSSLPNRLCGPEAGHPWFHRSPMHGARLSRGAGGFGHLSPPEIDAIQTHVEERWDELAELAA
jgi:hypothetical protein